MSPPRFATWLPLLLVLLPRAAWAQGEPQQSWDLTGKHVQIETARNVFTFIDSVVLNYQGATVSCDRAERHGVTDDYNVYFYDNVRIRDRGATMTGDSGEFSQLRNAAELRGNVVIVDSTGTIRADRVRYERDARLLWLWGHVDFLDATTQVLADSVRYQQDTGLGEAFGNVVLIDRARDSEARGPHGFYDRASGEAWLDPKPRLVLRRDGRETSIAAEERFWTSKDRSIVRVRGNVVIQSGNTTAWSDSALFYVERNVLQLRGRPRVAQGASRISGGEIDVQFGADDVERVDVRRRALLVQTRADTLLVPESNQVAGDSAVIRFAAGKLQRAVVSGHGSSQYVPIESGNRLSLNEAEADSIVMLFAADEVEEVLFLGNATGVYRFYEGDLEALRQGRTAGVDTVFGVVRGDTTRFDFRRQAERVEYSGERILYLAPFNDLHLQGAAQVHYQGRTLKAGDIVFDADTELLTARDEPVLLEGSERFYGNQMGYDLGERSAYVTGGSTSFDQGYYRGQRIRRAPDGTLDVVRGRYTSCDLETPHYDFRSNEMRIYLRDKAVGRPVYLYLGGIPILYLPFFFNSIDPGRKSGFLMPDVEFGLGTDSRYIRGLSYYWTASSYWDVLFNSAYNERSRLNPLDPQASAGQSRNIQIGANLRYKVRYKLDGNVEYRRSDDIDSDAHFVTMRGSHHQTLGERMTLNGTLDYASSDKAVRATSEFVDYDRARQRQLTSSLTFNRRDGLASTTVSLQRRQIIDPDPNIVNQAILSQTLPSLSLRFRSIRLAPVPRGDAPGLQRFLSDLQFAPNLNVRRDVDDIRLSRFVDSTGAVVPNPTGVPDSLLEFYTESVQRLGGSTSLSLARQSSLWIFTTTPSVSYATSYTDDDRIPRAFADRFTHSLSAGVQASTRLYGIYRPHFGSLRALRHTVEPSASYSYAAGLSGQTARQSLALSLRNTLDGKVEVDGKDRRVDGLLEWSLSTNYDPDRLRRWGAIGSVLMLNRHGPLTLRVSQTIDPYRRKIVSTSIPFALRLGGTFADYGEAEAAPVNRIVQEEGAGAAAGDSLGPARNWGFSSATEDGLEMLERRGRQPAGERLSWELALSYSLNRTDGKNLSKNVAVGAALRPTRKWTLRWRANFDTSRREFISPSLDVERDLHCWRASFSRVYARGEGWRYYFRIYVLRHQSELFLESGDRSFSH